MTSVAGVTGDGVTRWLVGSTWARMMAELGEAAHPARPLMLYPGGCTGKPEDWFGNRAGEIQGLLIRDTGIPCLVSSLIHRINPSPIDSSYHFMIL